MKKLTKPNTSTKSPPEWEEEKSISDDPMFLEALKKKLGGKIIKLVIFLVILIVSFFVIPDIIVMVLSLIK